MTTYQPSYVKAMCETGVNLGRKTRNNDGSSRWQCMLAISHGRRWWRRSVAAT